MGLIRTFGDLVRVLEEGAIPHRSHADAHVVELPSPDELPGPVTVGFSPRVPFVVVRQVMFDNLAVDRLPDLEAAIARVNHHLDAGGFSVDHLRRRLEYRVSVPLFDGISADALGKIARGVIANAREFATTFGAVIAGRPGAEVAQIYKDVAHARATRFA